MTHVTLPFATAPGEPATLSANIALLQMRPVTDIPVTVGELPKGAIREGMNAEEALAACGIAQRDCVPAGKMILQTTWFGQNATTPSRFLGGRAPSAVLSYFAETDPDAATAAMHRRLQGITENPVPIAASGRTRYNLIAALLGKYLYHDKATLFLNREQEEGFLSALREGILTAGAQVLCVSGVSDPNDLHFIGEVQSAAADLNLKLVVDARDEPIPGRDPNNSLTTYFMNAARADGNGKIALVKPNLEEFCGLAKTFLGVELDPARLNYSLRDGKFAEFEAQVLPLVRQLADLCLVAGSGQFILSCGAYPFYVVTAGNDEALRVTPPRIQVVSPIGAGDSMLAMAALFMAYGTPIGPEQAVFLAAAGAATAKRPGSELGTMAEIFAIANDSSENGIKVETVAIPKRG